MSDGRETGDAVVREARPRGVLILSQTYPPDVGGVETHLADLTAVEHRLLDRGYYLARNRILFMRRYARCYPLFLCLVPLWCLYYLNRYRRNGRLADFRDYWRGTWDGLLNRDGRARGDTIASGLEEETGVKEESGFRVKGSGGPAPDSRPLTPEPWLMQDEAKPWLR